MKPLRYLVVPLAILSIAVVQGKECVVYASVQVDRGDGGIETIYNIAGNAQVIVVGPGETATMVFECNMAAECGLAVRSVLSLNGTVLHDQPLSWSNSVPLTQEGFYVPRFTGEPQWYGWTNFGGDAPFFLSFTAPGPPLALNVKVWLDGPYNSGTQLMNDGLRSNGLIPLTNNGTTINASVLTVTGSNAIVDWVTVSVRRDGYTLKGWNALLQRDGDIVGSDGVSSLSFALPAGNYNVMVRHRNHLGCVTTPVAFTANTTVDMRDPNTAMVGTDARKTVGSTRTFWPGSAGGTEYEYPKRISYTGTNNDRDPILVRIGGSIPTATVLGYHREDVNLDGVVKYTGANNDRDPILTTIGGTVPTVVRVEQMP